MKFLHFNLKFWDLSLLCILLFPSCNSLDGKIEIRAKKVYLVNSSTNKKFEFTIKETKIKNDSSFNYATQIIKLAPGNEELLGMIDSTTEIKYPLLKKQICKIYNFNNQKVNFNAFEMDVDVLAVIGSGISVEKFIATLPDTIIKGEKLKYRFTTENYYDSLHPLPQDIYKCKFEVTGQLQLKDR